MAITEAGLRVLDTYRQLAESLEALERELQAAGPSLAGPATLYVAEALATGWLVPRLRDFAVRYPDIQLTVLTTTGTPPALAPGAADAALMLTAAPPGHFVGRRLGGIAICGYRAESAAAPADLANAQASEHLVGPLLPEFANAWHVSGRMPAVEGPVHCPALLAQLEACRAGLGVAVLPCALGDAFRGLMRAEPAAPLPAGEVWLLSHPDSRGIARLQALLGYVQEIWTTDRARLEGRSEAASSVANA